MNTNDNLAMMFINTARENGQLTAQYKKDDKGIFQPISFSLLLDKITMFAEGMLELGAKKGENIGLISDNRAEWVLIDLALLGLGVRDVPRGNDATEQELEYILSFSECNTVIAENTSQAMKIAGLHEKLPLLKTIIVIDVIDQNIAQKIRSFGLKLYSFIDVSEKGRARFLQKGNEYEKIASTINENDIATIIYTSGTTGEPKGVMLTHKNFLHQSVVLQEKLYLEKGQIWLSVLPVWHVFERIVQYTVLRIASILAYSKPIAQIMLPDFAAINPQWMASVPRIWEAVMEGVYRTVRKAGGIKYIMFSFFLSVALSYNYFEKRMNDLFPDFGKRNPFVDKFFSILPLILLFPLKKLGQLLVFNNIKKKLGTRFVSGITGGGAMAPAVEEFFSAIGISILEGYGLTETAPVIALRPQYNPVCGTVGPALSGTEFKICDEKGNDLGSCVRGIVYVRGPQVMKGYYKKPELTAKVLSDDGWFNTGDLGMLDVNGFLKLTGRAKDTIVLSGGENIEPVPIEQRLCESRFIKQSVVVGQDQKYLGVLIVPDPEALKSWCISHNIEATNEAIYSDEVKELFSKEIADKINNKSGFKHFETISRFTILEKSFDNTKAMSAKQEIKRYVIAEEYKDEIEKMFA